MEFGLPCVFLPVRVCLFRCLLERLSFLPSQSLWSEKRMKYVLGWIGRRDALSSPPLPILVAPSRAEISIPIMLTESDLKESAANANMQRTSIPNKNASLPPRDSQNSPMLQFPPRYKRTNINTHISNRSFKTANARSSSSQLAPSRPPSHCLASHVADGWPAYHPAVLPFPT